MGVHGSVSNAAPRGRLAASPSDGHRRVTASQTGPRFWPPASAGRVPKAFKGLCAPDFMSGRMDLEVMGDNNNHNVMDAWCTQGPVVGTLQKQALNFQMAGCVANVTGNAETGADRGGPLWVPRH